MAKAQSRAPRNRDQDIPPRKGESIEATPPERGKGDRDPNAPLPDRNAPLPEEESYERAPRNERP